MARLTRADSQARTREQLLATATTLFLRDGYFATSLDRVADEAGYSKGAVYSNFRGKDELCLAVLDRIRTEQAARLVEAMSARDSLEARLDAFETWAQTAVGDEGWCTLEVEFGSQVHRNPRLRKAYRERGAVIRRVVADLVRTFAGDAELVMPADELATALVSIGVGLGLQRAIDPELPVRTLTTVVRVLTGAIARPAPHASLRSPRAGRARS